ncbi:MAG TPA: hypothetical protein VFF73_26555 [Planctomycetota bacterium]|nr:hypothetical protein [Planctomycetota bacterium]
MGQDNYIIELLERAYLVQQKRVWSLETLAKLERRTLLGNATDEARNKMREFLEGNLRIAKVVLDEIAKELGYSSPTRKILDPTFVLGARGEGVSNKVLEKLDRVDSAQREEGTQHYAAMMRELLVTHEGFLEDVQTRVQEDVAMSKLLENL